MGCKIAFAGGMTLVATSASAGTPSRGTWQRPVDSGVFAIRHGGGAITSHLVGFARLDGDAGGAIRTMSIRLSVLGP